MTNSVVVFQTNKQTNKQTTKKNIEFFSFKENLFSKTCETRARTFVQFFSAPFMLTQMVGRRVSPESSPNQSITKQQRAHLRGTPGSRKKKKAEKFEREEKIII
jgi:hypothetical protein